MGRRTMSDREWSEHVAVWKASGVSEAAYCQAHGLALRALSKWRWRQRVKDGAAGGTLTFVQAQRMDAQGAPLLRMITPQGWQLEFATLPSPAWVREMAGGGR